MPLASPIKILLQTTIPDTPDDWDIARFSLLRDHLSGITDPKTGRKVEVVARNRKAGPDGADPVLSTLEESDFDQLWLMAVDSGDGLSDPECEAITRFHNQGGGILSTRDHQDLGSSLCTLGGIGEAHFFQTRNPEPDPERHRIDDRFTTSISWPNYHSGANGDYQKVTAVQPVHPLLVDPKSEKGVIELFPSHPHEGAVGVPAGNDQARVVATGKSKVTNRPFNLVVALDRQRKDGKWTGRGIAESSFHHLVDYNWDVSKGCPSFVEEKPGQEIERNPDGLRGIKQYVKNAVSWLSRERE